MYRTNENQVKNLDLLNGHLALNRIRSPQKMRIPHRGHYLNSKHETKL